MLKDQKFKIIFYYIEVSLCIPEHVSKKSIRMSPSRSLAFSSSVIQFSGLLNKQDTHNRSCFEASLKGKHPNTIEFSLLMSRTIFSKGHINIIGLNKWSYVSGHHQPQSLMN